MAIISDLDILKEGNQEGNYINKQANYNTKKMYWRLGFGVNKEIDQILDNHNVELEEILQEDSVVHESKSHNYRLIEYLTLPHNLRKLLSYSIGKATVDDDRNKLRWVF